MRVGLATGTIRTSLAHNTRTPKKLRYLALHSSLITATFPSSSPQSPPLLLPALPLFLHDLVATSPPPALQTHYSHPAPSLPHSQLQPIPPAVHDRSTRGPAPAPTQITGVYPHNTYQLQAKCYDDMVFPERQIY
jgi:hypothetical protein